MSSCRPRMDAAGRPSRDSKPCTMHESMHVDRRNGLRAGPKCPPRFVRSTSVFERYEGPFRAWAAAAGRPVSPNAFSPLCPGSRSHRFVRTSVRIGWPNDGSRFVLDPERPYAQQELLVRLEVPDRTWSTSSFSSMAAQSCV